MQLQDFIEEEGISPGSIYTREFGKSIKDAIIGIAAFDTGLLSGWGSTYTPAVGDPVVITGATIVDLLVELALKSQVYFWANTTVNASKPMSTPRKYPKKYGTEVIERETGERMETVNAEIINYIYNIENFEKFVQASPGYDFVFFTNTTAFWVRSGANTPVVHSYGYELTGNADSTAGSGKFAVSWHSEKGDLPHEPGVLLSKLSANRLKYTFAAASSLSSNLAKEPCGGGKERYKRTGTAASATFTRAINEANSCVRWVIKPISANAVTNIAKATINPTTGVVTIASDLATGTYDFQVIAENEVGIFGSYSFTLVIAA